MTFRVIILLIITKNQGCVQNTKVHAKYCGVHWSKFYGSSVGWNLKGWEVLVSPFLLLGVGRLLGHHQDQRVNGWWHHGTIS